MKNKGKLDKETTNGALGLIFSPSRLCIVIWDYYCWILLYLRQETFPIGGHEGCFRDFVGKSSDFTGDDWVVTEGLREINEAYMSGMYIAKEKLGVGEDQKGRGAPDGIKLLQLDE